MLTVYQLLSGEEDVIEGGGRGGGGGGLVDINVGRRALWELLLSFFYGVLRNTPLWFVSFEKPVGMTRDASEKQKPPIPTWIFCPLHLHPPLLLYY